MDDYLLLFETKFIEYVKINIGLTHTLLLYPGIAILWEYYRTSSGRSRGNRNESTDVELGTGDHKERQ